MSLAFGLALLVPFAWWERRSADPVVAFSLFRSVQFSAGTAVIALLNLVMYALTGNYKSDQVHLPAIMQRLTQ